MSRCYFWIFFGYYLELIPKYILYVCSTLSCLTSISNVTYIQRQVLYNKIKKVIGFKGKKILFVNNDMFIEKYYKELLKK